MGECSDDSFSIAIVSGKLGGVDGVSLEADKWIAAMNELGHRVVTIAGEYPQPVAGVTNEAQIEEPALRFTSEFQQRVESLAFPHMWDHPVQPSAAEVRELVERIRSRGRELGVAMQRTLAERDVDLVVAENTNAMPMTILGGVAVHYLATDRRVPTLFHHHDFWWERSRFADSRIEPLLTEIMPPVDLGLEHVVISSYAAHILTSLKRVQPVVIPNCEDFAAPVGLDDYSATFRSDLGFDEQDILVVQPTRIVPRKRIEDSIRFVARLAQRAPHLRDRLRYVISLYQGDEPDAGYLDMIRSLAARLGVDLHLISDRVQSSRGIDGEGRRLYTNRDVLANADLVTYLSIWEGFGNALLEALAAGVPAVTATYLVYKTDIMPLGLRIVEIPDRYERDGSLIIADRQVDEALELLENRARREEWAAHNRMLGEQEFGLARLRERIASALAGYSDEIRAGRVRRRKATARYPV